MLSKLFKDKVNGKSVNIIMASAIGAMCAGMLLGGVKPETTSAQEAIGTQSVTETIKLPTAYYSTILTEPKERESGYMVLVDGEHIATVTEQDYAMLNAYLAGRINEQISSPHSSASYSEDIEFAQGSYATSDFLALDDVISLMFDEDENGSRLVSLSSNYVMSTEEPIPFETVEVENPLLPKGESFVSQEGEDGASTALSLVTETNGEIVKTQEFSRAVTKQPVNKVIEIGTATFDNLMWPVGAGGGFVSSDYGFRTFDDSFHKGIDICGVPEGSDIYAVYAGTVIRSEINQNGYGEFVVIDHGNGYHTAYAHMSSRDVQVGDMVLAGDRIGGIGTTGQSTGVHLHFEVRCGGEFANPNDFLA